MEVWGGSQPADRGVIMPGLDAWILSRPYQGASEGGDVHYVSSCATGRITRMLVADISGHGASVAQTAGGLRTLMRRYVNYIDQTRFVEEMNRRFADLAASNTFATALVLTYFAPTGHLSVSNAGHPPPMLYSSTSRTWKLLEHRRTDRSLSNMPLGVLDATQYDQFDVRMATGDLVFCYTDSLIESRDEQDQLLGPERLLTILRELGPIEPSELIEELLRRIGSLSPGNLTDDDVTAFLIRSNGMAPRLTMGERLQATWHVMKGCTRALARRGEPAPIPEVSIANIGGAMFGPLSRFWRGRRKAEKKAPAKSLADA